MGLNDIYSANNKMGPAFEARSEEEILRRLKNELVNQNSIPEIKPTLKGQTGGPRMDDGSIPVPKSNPEVDKPQQAATVNLTPNQRYQQYYGGTPQNWQSMSDAERVAHSLVFGTDWAQNIDDSVFGSGQYSGSDGGLTREEYDEGQRLFDEIMGISATDPVNPGGLESPPDSDPYGLGEAEMASQPDSYELYVDTDMGGNSGFQNNFITDYELQSLTEDEVLNEFNSNVYLQATFGSAENYLNYLRDVNEAGLHDFANDPLEIEGNLTGGDPEEVWRAFLASRAPSDYMNQLYGDMTWEEYKNDPRTTQLDVATVERWGEGYNGPQVGNAGWQQNVANNEELQSIFNQYATEGDDEFFVSPDGMTAVNADGDEFIWTGTGWLITNKGFQPNDLGLAIAAGTTAAITAGVGSALAPALTPALSSVGITSPAVASGVASGLTSAGTQALTTGEVDIGQAIVSGLTAGALDGFTSLDQVQDFANSLSTGNNIADAALAAGGTDALSQLVTTGEVDFEQAATSALIGGGVEAAGQFFGQMGESQEDFEAWLEDDETLRILEEGGLEPGTVSGIIYDEGVEGNPWDEQAPDTLAGPEGGDLNSDGYLNDADDALANLSNAGPAPESVVSPDASGGDFVAADHPYEDLIGQAFEAGATIEDIAIITDMSPEQIESILGAYDVQTPTQGDIPFGEEFDGGPGQIIAGEDVPDLDQPPQDIEGNPWDEQAPDTLGGPTQGDFDYDGYVTDDDFEAWLEDDETLRILEEGGLEPGTVSGITYDEGAFFSPPDATAVPSNDRLENAEFGDWLAEMEELDTPVLTENPDGTFEHTLDPFYDGDDSPNVGTENFGLEDVVGGNWISTVPEEDIISSGITFEDSDYANFTGMVASDSDQVFYVIDGPDGYELTDQYGNSVRWQGGGSGDADISVGSDYTYSTLDPLSQHLVNGGELPSSELDTGSTTTYFDDFFTAPEEQPEPVEPEEQPEPVEPVETETPDQENPEGPPNNSDTSSALTGAQGSSSTVTGDAGAVSSDVGSDQATDPSTTGSSSSTSGSTSTGVPTPNLSPSEIVIFNQAINDWQTVTQEELDAIMDSNGTVEVPTGQDTSGDPDAVPDATPTPKPPADGSDDKPVDDAVSDDDADGDDTGTDDDGTADSGDDTGSDETTGDDETQQPSGNTFVPSSCESGWEDENGVCYPVGTDPNAAGDPGDGTPGDNNTDDGTPGPGDGPDDPGTGDDPNDPGPGTDPEGDDTPGPEDNDGDDEGGGGVGSGFDSPMTVGGRASSSSSEPVALADIAPFVLSGALDELMREYGSNAARGPSNEDAAAEGARLDAMLDELLMEQESAGVDPETAYNNLLQTLGMA